MGSRPLPRRPLPQGKNSNGRPVWEPPLFDYRELIGEAYEEKRKTLLSYYRNDVVKTTAFLDFDAEHQLLGMYKDLAFGEQQRAQEHGDSEETEFFRDLRREIIVDFNEAVRKSPGFSLMLRRREDTTSFYKGIKWIDNTRYEVTDYLEVLQDSHQRRQQEEREEAKGVPPPTSFKDATTQTHDEQETEEEEQEEEGGDPPSATFIDATTQTLPRRRMVAIESNYHRHRPRSQVRTTEVTDKAKIVLLMPITSSYHEKVPSPKTTPTLHLTFPTSDEDILQNPHATSYQASCQEVDYADPISIWHPLGCI